MNAPRKTWGAMKTPLARRIRSRSPSISGATIMPSKLSLARSTSCRASIASSARAGMVRAVKPATISAAATSRLPLGNLIGLSSSLSDGNLSAESG